MQKPANIDCVLLEQQQISLDDDVAQIRSLGSEL